MNQDTCNHQWMQVNEEFLLGGYNPIGYECEVCGKFICQDKLTPSGIGGTMTSKHKLVGPHGGRGHMASGEIYKEQIYDAKTGELKIIK